MKIYPTIHAAAAVLASFMLFSGSAGAVKPNGTDANGNPTAQFVIGGTELQDLTGADFKPSSIGMEILAIRSASGVLPAAGFEKGDTILSVNRTRTTDLQSLISAVKDAKGKVVEVVGIDHRTGQIVVVNVGF